MEEWLVVDGYNIIRANPDYSTEMEIAREELVHDLIEYQAVTGQKVFIVFDAYQFMGARTKNLEKRIQIIYTNKEETADTRIEHFVRKSMDENRHIYVATSDYLEQRIVFGQGAYRVSARELIDQLKRSKKHIRVSLGQRETKTIKSPLAERISDTLKHQLEKWRRKK